MYKKQIKRQNYEYENIENEYKYQSEIKKYYILDLKITKYYKDSDFFCRFNLQNFKKLKILCTVSDSNETATCEAEKKAQIYYRSCLDRKEIVEKRGAQPLLDVLAPLGGWHVTSDGQWDVGKFDFQTSMEKIHALDIGIFFAMWVSIDEKNSSQNIIQVI